MFQTFTDISISALSECITVAKGGSGTRTLPGLGMTEMRLS